MIRLATLDDASVINAIYCHFIRESSATFEELPLSELEMRQRIEIFGALAPWLVFERDGAIQAYAYASPHLPRASYRWSVNVTVYVRPGHGRRGIGRALYTKLFAALKLQGFHNAVAGITLPNEASVGLHEALGFEPVALYRSIGFKFGEWRDVGWWQLRLQEHRGAPRETLSTAALLKLPEGRKLLGMDSRS